MSGCYQSWCGCVHHAEWVCSYTGRLFCGIHCNTHCDRPLYAPPPAALDQTAKTNAGVSPFCLALRAARPTVAEFVAGLELGVRCDLSGYPSVPLDEDSLAALEDYELIDFISYEWTPLGRACGEAVRR